MRLGRCLISQNGCATIRGAPGQTTRYTALRHPTSRPRWTRYAPPSAGGAGYGEPPGAFSETPIAVASTTVAPGTTGRTFPTPWGTGGTTPKPAAPGLATCRGNHAQGHGLPWLRLSPLRLHLRLPRRVAGAWRRRRCWCREWPTRTVEHVLQQNLWPFESYYTPERGGVEQALPTTRRSRTFGAASSSLADAPKNWLRAR